MAITATMATSILVLLLGPGAGAWVVDLATIQRCVPSTQYLLSIYTISTQYLQCLEM